ncbi:hypothetical protein ACQCVB_19750 [Fictibacillus phosphorivorans]|uniref:hypothetical protein n=1 Tax=Fictibacillus phosphorivorans TaxID=1221500 RepID=UPI003CF9AF2D
MPENKLSEEQINAIVNALESLHKKFDHVSDHLNYRFSIMNEKLDSIENKIPGEYDN